MDPEDGRDAREDINVERERAVLARLLAPIVIGGSRRIAKDQQALLFRQAPEIGNSEERPQTSRAEPPSVGGRKARSIQALRRSFSFRRVRFGLPHRFFRLSRFEYNTNMDIVQAQKNSGFRRGLAISVAKAEGILRTPEIAKKKPRSKAGSLVNVRLRMNWAPLSTRWATCS